MPDVADYRVISDGGSATFQIGGLTDFTFKFDLGTAVKHNQPAILQFFISSSNANNLNVGFHLNGKLFMPSIHLTGKVFATMHEIGSGMTKNNVNELRILLSSGTGSLTISNIVLFVQRTV
jgi:hypothetical protein